MKRSTKVTSFHFMNSCRRLRAREKIAEEASANKHRRAFKGCVTTKHRLGCFFSLETYTSVGALLRWGCYLLWVAGHVWQHGGHVEHYLIALVGGVQGVGARRVRWRKDIC